MDWLKKKQEVIAARKAEEARQIQEFISSGKCQELSAIDAAKMKKTYSNTPKISPEDEKFLIFPNSTT